MSYLVGQEAKDGIPETLKAPDNSSCRNVRVGKQQKTTIQWVKWIEEKMNTISTQVFLNGLNK